MEFVSCFSISAILVQSFHTCEFMESKQTSSSFFISIIFPFQTCLSRGGCFYFPPCHMLEVCGFRIQFDCPMDFSALPIFSPVPLDFYVISDEELSTHPGNGSFNFENVSEEKIEKPLDVGSLIKAEPWYKIINNLRLWNPSFTDIVLISSPMGMLGLPFLTREKDFSAKVDDSILFALDAV